MMKQTGRLLCVMLLCMSQAGVIHVAAADPQALAVDKTVNSTSESTTTIRSTAEGNTTDQQATHQSTGQTTKNTSIKSIRPVASDFKSVSAPDIGSGLIQVTFGLFVVLMIIAGAAWFTRRFGQFQATAGGALRIVGGLHLGAKERLVVVQVGEEQLLLGVAPGRVSKLHLLAKPLNIANDGLSKSGRNTTLAPGNFREYLTAVLKRDSK